MGQVSEIFQIAYCPSCGKIFKLSGNTHYYISGAGENVKAYRICNECGKKMSLLTNKELNYLQEDCNGKQQD